MVTSEWGLPPQFENGTVPEDLLANKYGHHIHFWDLRARRNVETIDLGANHQMYSKCVPRTIPFANTGSWASWDNHFYPDGVPGAEVMANAGPERRARAGKGLLGELPRRIPSASDPARGRRLLDGFVLLSVG